MNRSVFRRITWRDAGAVGILVPAILVFVWCWIRMGDVGMQSIDAGGPGTDITGYSIALLTSFVVAIVMLTFFVVRIQRAQTLRRADPSLQSCHGGDS
jgi:hypothetical protein